MSDKPHERFTVSGTAYMRSLSRDDLYHHPWVAIHYQEAPKPGSKPNTTSYGLRFPALIVVKYVDKAEEMATKVAKILNQHWDDEESVPAQEMSYRELAERAGYSVHQRSTHGPANAYDWGPKSPMLSNHFRSREDAWADLERVMKIKLTEARKLVAIAGPGE